MRTLKHPCPYFEKRKAFSKVKFLIFHFTETESLEDMLGAFELRKVSAHYAIDHDGTVIDIVDPSMRAFHAGISFWQNFENLNDFSIGIEIVNNGQSPYTNAQIDTLITLSKKLIKTFNIKPHHILGHSDIAPDRKVDPGPLFPWQKLAEQGIGLYPNEVPNIKPLPENAEDLAKEHLQTIGYALDKAPFNHILRAFQHHFSPHHLSQKLDAETFARIKQVANLYSEKC